MRINENGHNNKQIKKKIYNRILAKLTKIIYFLEQGFKHIIN